MSLSKNKLLLLGIIQRRNATKPEHVIDNFRPYFAKLEADGLIEKVYDLTDKGMEAMGFVKNQWGEWDEPPSAKRTG